MASKRVFISHSHKNRDVALSLHRLLSENHAETFFDQESMEAGNDLPKRLVEGVSWCESMLLIWSGAASRSTWVQKEWKLACQEEKQILPYVLDGTPLPGVLANIVHVDSSDRKHGYANLLRAIFGKGFVPEGPSPFPGNWRLTLDPGGLVDRVNGMDFGAFLPRGGGYTLELRQNGQVRGSFSLGGLPGAFAGIFGGGSNMSKMKSPVQGSWEFDPDEEVLTLDLQASVMGQHIRELISIVVIEKDFTSLRGESTDGKSWIVERLD